MGHQRSCPSTKTTKCISQKPGHHVADGDMDRLPGGPTKCQRLRLWLGLSVDDDIKLHIPVIILSCPPNAGCSAVTTSSILSAIAEASLAVSRRADVNMQRKLRLDG